MEVKVVQVVCAHCGQTFTICVVGEVPIDGVAECPFCQNDTHVDTAWMMHDAAVPLPIAA